MWTAAGLTPMDGKQGGRSAGPIDRSRWVFAALSLVAVAYAFVGAWLITAGPSDPIAHTAAFLDHLVSPWMMATYAVAAAFIAFGLWYMRRQPRQVDENRDVDVLLRRTALQFALVLVVVAASLTGIAWLYVRDLQSTSQAEHARQQDLVARLKAQQIGKWLVERSIDSELLAASLARLPLARLPGDGDVASVIALLFAETLAGSSERRAVTLFAPDGKVLVHVGAGLAPAPPVVEAARALGRAPATASRIVDIYDDSETPPNPRLAFLAPVAGRDPAVPPAAVLAVAVDPFRGLLEQIPAWPGPSPSSEVMVVRRDGEDVVFITPPRLSPEPPPNSYRVPLATSTLPAAQAVRRGAGVHSGVDYRGVDVLTATEWVKGLPWLVVAKTDEAELAAPLERRKSTLALVISAAIVLAALMLVVLWRGERAVLVAQQASAAAERAAISRHFAQLTRMARDIVLMLDPDGRIVEANQAALAAYGYSEDELYRLTVADLRTPEEFARFEEDWRAGRAPDGVLIETVHRRKDGTAFPVEISGRILPVDGKQYRQAFIRDISARKALERQVARLAQVRSALQAATSVLLRARSEAEMYDQICEVMVHQAGYRMANVSMPNDDVERSVRFVAVAGIDDGYLAQARITWGEGPRGRGPTGAALRTGEIQVNQNFASNPLTAPWSAEALKRGFQSSIGLPLRLDGRVFAAFTAYAEQPDAFDRDEVALLAALAEDIAYVVAKLRTQAGAG
jgi:PAS domain S-box-containing protein